MDKYIGKRLDGRYEIHELIGVGGMANVYRCNDTVDDREVAIKILKDEYLNNEEFIRRFKNESKAIAMLSHPNIVKVYDVSFGDMIQYIVMEYIDGITLKEYIDRQGIIEWKDVLHLTTQILKALQHAHECGIVSGDRLRALYRARAGERRRHRRQDRHLLSRRHALRDAHRQTAL